MTRLRGMLCFVLAFPLLSCQSLARFDTQNGAAYCGDIVDAKFVRTAEPDGFERDLRLRLEIDADQLSTFPGTLTTNDATTGPCAPHATFEHASLRVTKEIVNDALSAMTFEDGQVQNLVTWVDSTCRGSMLAVVSLLKNDNVDVRLLKPGVTPTSGEKRDAFGLFSLLRQNKGCGF